MIIFRTALSEKKNIIRTSKSKQHCPNSNIITVLPKQHCYKSNTVSNNIRTTLFEYFVRATRVKHQQDNAFLFRTSISRRTTLSEKKNAIRALNDDRTTLEEQNYLNNTITIRTPIIEQHNQYTTTMTTLSYIIVISPLCYRFILAFYSMTVLSRIRFFL